MTNKVNESSSVLVPRLGLFSATMLVIGSIIGSGIFKKIAPMTLKLQSPNLVLLAWIIAGVITIFGALSYAEIANRLAQTGGLYAYLKSIYGNRVAYLFGWACFSVIQSASIASIAYVFAEAILRFLPLAQAGLDSRMIAVLTILGLSLVNYFGIVYGALVTNTFTVLKVLGIAVVVIIGFMGGGSHASPTPLVTLPAVPSDWFHLIPVFFSAMLGAFWAFDGLNNIGFVGGEIKNAKHNIPKALIMGVLAVLGIYLIVNISYFVALPVQEICKIAQKSGSIFAIEMVEQLKGSSWALFVSALIMVSTFGTTNSSILSSSRIYYAMAQDGLFFKTMGVAHPRFHTPAISLLAQGVWASMLIYVGSFDELTDMLIFASFIFYGLGAWGVFRLRAMAKSKNEAILQIPSFVPALYIMFCAVLVVINLFQNPVEALRGIALILLGIPVFWIMKKSAL